MLFPPPHIEHIKQHEPDSESDSESDAVNAVNAVAEPKHEPEAKPEPEPVVIVPDVEPEPEPEPEPEVEPEVAVVSSDRQDFRFKVVDGSETVYFGVPSVLTLQETIDAKVCSERKAINRVNRYLS